MLGIYPTDILANIYLENPFNRIIALKIDPEGKNTSQIISVYRGHLFLLHAVTSWVLYLSSLVLLGENF